MQQSDLAGIKRSGAKAHERGVSYFDNSHLGDADDTWLVAATAWAGGWREVDRGKDVALATLDRVRWW